MPHVNLLRGSKALWRKCIVMTSKRKAPGQGKKAIQSKASTCRDLLIKLKSATYLVHDAKALDEVNTALQSTLTSISDFIPNEKGLQTKWRRNHPYTTTKKNKERKSCQEQQHPLAESPYAFPNMQKRNTHTLKGLVYSQKR